MIEKFKEMLFNALHEASKIKQAAPLYRIGREVLTGFDGIDLRVFMDSEMKSLTIVEPYKAMYIGLESDENTLTFLDISPIVKEYANAINIIQNFYDEDARMVKQIVVETYPKKDA